MTREQIAVYLITMAWMENEPVTAIEFELKVNTRKRGDYAQFLKDEVTSRCGKYAWNAFEYYSKDPRITWITHRDWEPYPDTMSIRVYAGSWSDKEHLKWLEKELSKKKVNYSKIERR